MLATQEKFKGGFTATREFTGGLQEMFPDLDVSGVPEDAAALVVTVMDHKWFNFRALFKVLIGAAKGGISTVVIHFKTRDLVQVLPILTLSMIVEQGVHDIEERRLEAAMRVAA